MLTIAQVREAFHVLLLRELAPPLGTALRLKGGVNLRLFFGSIRYSEDMDLDADRRLEEPLRRKLPSIIGSTGFRRRLYQLGVEVEPPSAPAKNTGTVLRYKLRLVLGGVPYPTKIEVSYRNDAPRSWARLASPLPEIVRPYLEHGGTFPPIGHYAHRFAVRQKIRALAGRTAVQARDAFDLAMLAEQRHGSLDFGFLRDTLTDAVIAEARERAFGISVAVFRDQVGEFLAPDQRDKCIASWEDSQLAVTELLDVIQRTPRSGPPPSRDEVGRP
jgi:hypothetical protein